MEKIVELKNVSKIYKIGEKEFKAIDNIDLSLNKGEIFVVSALGTFIVVYVTNQFLAKKVRKIDMVSSLKGNE